MSQNSNILICTDLDRTLLPNGSQELSPHALKLFKKLVEHPDIKLAYVSGRHKHLLKEAINQYHIPVPDFAITDVGASIYSVSDSRWEKWTDWHDFISSDWGTHTQHSLSELLGDINILKLQEDDKQGKFKLSYYAATDIDTTSLLNEITTRFNNRNIKANLIWSIDETTNTGLLDILPAKGNKLHAIEFLINKLSYTKEQIIYAGDSGNDLEVLSSHLPSVLVANATNEVRKQSLQLSKLNNNEQMLYLAKGGFMEMNGNYVAGILEGVCHFYPQIEKILKSSN